jgi:hypothetical protein
MILKSGLIFFLGTCGLFAAGREGSKWGQTMISD